MHFSDLDNHKSGLWVLESWLDKPRETLRLPSVRGSFLMDFWQFIDTTCQVIFINMYQNNITKHNRKILPSVSSTDKH